MTYYAKGKRMYQYPANSTICRLRAKGFREIVWRNGDFIAL